MEDDNKRRADLRKDKIFQIVVHSYVETAEPVGSRTISKHHDLGLSPASIRNVMADLEEEGFLKQPHTSAGRVPTDKGYRYYVDRLMEREELTGEEKARIWEEIGSARTVEGMAEKVSKVISSLTENAALIYLQSLKRLSFLTGLLEELMDERRRLEEYLEEEPGLFIEGAFRVIGQPEFRDTEKLLELLQVFEEKNRFIRLITADLAQRGIHVHIGSENSGGGLDGVSVVVKECELGGLPIGGIAVVGPTRMKYSKVVAVVNFVADTVSERVKHF